jgi:hypothetical protein
MTTLTRGQWIAIAAHRLQHRWRSINPGQLDEVAAELWQDEYLKSLDPSTAIDEWLMPIVDLDGKPVRKLKRA